MAIPELDTAMTQVVMNQTSYSNRRYLGTRGSVLFEDPRANSLVTVSLEINKLFYLKRGVATKANEVGGGGGGGFYHFEKPSHIITLLR